MSELNKTLKEKSQERIDHFIGELFSHVMFDLSQDGQAMYAHCVEDSAKSCDITIQELLNQHEMRQKLASISWLIMPQMCESEYYEFIQDVVDTVRDLAEESTSEDIKEYRKNHHICTCVHPQ
jgi:hypothetical protein